GLFPLADDHTVVMNEPGDQPERAGFPRLAAQVLAVAPDAPGDLAVRVPLHDIIRADLVSEEAHALRVLAVVEITDDASVAGRGGLLAVEEKHHLRIEIGRPVAHGFPVLPAAVLR